MATATARRRRAVEHLVATDLARVRLARAAFDAVADGLDLGPTALRSPADRAWAHAVVAHAIQQAADRAIEELVGELIAGLSGAELNLVARVLAGAPELVDGGLARPADPGRFAGRAAAPAGPRNGVADASAALPR